MHARLLDLTRYLGLASSTSKRALVCVCTGLLGGLAKRLNRSARNDDREADGGLAQQEDDFTYRDLTPGAPHSFALKA